MDLRGCERADAVAAWQKHEAAGEEERLLLAEFDSDWLAAAVGSEPLLPFERLARFLAAGGWRPSSSRRTILVAASSQPGHHTDMPGKDRTHENPMGTGTPALRLRRPYLVFNARNRLRLIPVDAIHWIEGSGNYVRVHCGEGKFLIRAPMSLLERELTPSGFLRVHRGALVPLREMRELVIEERTRAYLELRSGHKVRVNRAFRHWLLEEGSPRLDRPSGTRKDPRTSPESRSAEPR